MDKGGDKANAIAAIDLLLNLLMLFLVITAISIPKMRKPDAGVSIEMKAELVLELTWPSGNFDDLDMWLMLPNGERVGFTNKDVGVATLDRDDRGAYGDTYFAANDKGRTEIIQVNKEVIAIRANVPGKYVVNVHYYNDFSPEEIGVEETDPSPNPSSIKLTKLNPTIEEIANRKLDVGKVGSQSTALCFRLDETGLVSDVDLSCNHPFVPTAREGLPSNVTVVSARR